MSYQLFLHVTPARHAQVKKDGPAPGTEAFPDNGPCCGTLLCDALPRRNVRREAHQRFTAARMLAASLTSNLPGASTASVLTTPSSTTIA